MNVTVQEKVSKKTGKKYNVLVVECDNGYTLELFLTNEQAFILKSL